MILEKLYEISLKPYRLFKKNEAWKLNVTDLLRYPEHSLGYALGRFLLNNLFDLQGKSENHDVFHVLTGIGVTILEEIEMQFYLMGNGKRSFYLFSVIFLGSVFYPEKMKFFVRHYYQGKNALPFYQLDFYKLLDQPIERLKNTLSIH
ncbi:ubiquinone biosynthesis protein COQ4 [Maribacter cobaltidurans]|nr:ubiquinone biosynthesis protein COQ4 [Maribacter cobaltidurans]GGD70333.1 hypothetical protein GCM10011412_04890 [Maribacter cobaltidurans]